MDSTSSVIITNNHCDLLHEQNIGDFYAEKCIFITGATGFIGKQVLEKLLRSCSKLKKVYALMRSTKRHSANERLHLMLNSKLFQRVTDADPNVVDKVHVMEGDISKPHLGLREVDIQTIVNEVSVVFHLAATVSFNEPMKVAVNLNIVGLQSTLILCKKIKHLEALVHVSTAYANCTRQFIDEITYPPPIHHEKILSVSQWMSDEIFQIITPMVLEDHPNTYTFTKAIAETLLMEERGDLPVAIYRPSIVTASLQEPFPGWVDNLNGATGVLTAIGSGFVKSVYGGGDVPSDLVPVDLVANSIIAVAWHLASTKGPHNKVPIYNFTSGSKCPLTWGQVGAYLTDIFRRYPMDNPTSIPKAFLTYNRLAHTYILHFEIFFRLMTLDFLRRIFGYKPRLLRIHGNVVKLMRLMEYFTSNGWTWSTDNVDHLRDCMSEHDKQVFNFDLKRINWPTYLESYCIGIRQHTLHQDMKSLQNARKVLKWLFMIRRLFVVVSVFIMFRLLVQRLETSSRLWKFFVSFFNIFLLKMPKIFKS